MDSNKQTIEKLNELLKKNIDAEKIYSKAAKDVKSAVLKNFFLLQASKRSKFASELTTEILGLGGSPDETGGTMENLGRIWMDLTTAVSQDSEEAILKACLAADKANLEKYKEVMLPENIKTADKNILNNHTASIEATLNKIKNLEDVTAEFG